MCTIAINVSLSLERGDRLTKQTQLEATPSDAHEGFAVFEKKR